MTIDRLASVAFALALGANAASATIHVPADAPTIAAAVALALDGDVVELAPGVYGGEGNRDVVVAASITIIGVEGAAATIIDCEGSERAPHRAFDVSAPQFALHGVTIRNGLAQGDGGGVYLNAHPRKGNTLGSFVLVDCNFEQCRATPPDARYGGSGAAVGIWSATDVTIDRCGFVDNVASDGGAVACFDCSNVTIERSQFKGNFGGGVGGLHLHCWGVATLSRCEFAHNSSDYMGAAFVGAYWVDMRNCLFHHNQAPVIPVGYFGQTCEIDYCTFADNTSDDARLFSGALSLYYGYVRGSILWDGYSGNDALKLGCCIKDWDSALFGCTWADPMFVDPANEDYHLQAGSPLLDYGWIIEEFGGPVDLDGNARLVDLPWAPNGPTSLNDVGCYERQLPSPDLNGDGFTDASDLAILLGAWGPCNACAADLDGDGIVSAADLALLLGAWS